MTDADRVVALQRMGYTPRQAQFLVRVALHSGYFLRRQYVAFTGHGHGLATTRFLANLAAREHAKALPHPRLGHLWHLCAKPVYAAIDQADNRHRRPAEWAAVIRKLMALDFVLAHQEAQFYAAEADKVALLRDSYAIPETCWPAKLYAAKDPTGAITVRYFVDKMPWFREASDVRLWLSYVDDGETLAGFETFLTQYRSLLGALRSGLVHVSRSYDARVAAMFRRVVLGAKNHNTEQGLGSQARPLLEYCHLRRKLEARDWTGLTKADLHRFRDSETPSRPLRTTSSTTVGWPAVMRSWPGRTAWALRPTAPFGRIACRSTTATPILRNAFQNLIQGDAIGPRPCHLLLASRSPSATLTFSELLKILCRRAVTSRKLAGGPEKPLNRERPRCEGPSAARAHARPRARGRSRFNRSKDRVDVRGDDWMRAELCTRCDRTTLRFTPVMTAGLTMRSRDIVDLVDLLSESESRERVGARIGFMVWLAVGAGGALGAIARHGLNHMIHQRTLTSTFPLGIFVVNVGGSVIIGVLAGLLASERLQWEYHARTFVIVGILGGFTTFSSFSLDTITLIRAGHHAQALWNVVGQVGLSLLGVWAGFRVGSL